MIDFKIFGAAAIALSACVVSAEAATINLTDAAGINNYGVLDYTGLDGDIRGFFNGSLDDTRASWIASGNNNYEEDVVEALAGLPVGSASLSGEIPGSNPGVTWDAPFASYFTVKFGKSLFVLYNTTGSAITVTYTADADCKSNFANNQCSDSVSHSKFVAGEMTPVPLPATGWLLIAGLGGLGALRRRSKKPA